MRIYAINSQVNTLEKVDQVSMQEKLNLTIWIWTYLQSFNFLKIRRHFLQ